MTSNQKAITFSQSEIGCNRVSRVGWDVINDRFRYPFLNPESPLFLKDGYISLFSVCFPSPIKYFWLIELVWSVFSLQHRYLTKLKDISRAPCQSQNQCFESRKRRNGPLLSSVASVFAVTSWHLFPQRSKVFLKILETIEIYLGSKTTSNKVFVTYERSTCSKSNPLADACFWVSTFISQAHMSVAWVAGARKKGRARRRHACLPRARPFSLSPTISKRLLRRLVWVTRGDFESVQAHLNFFPFENADCITKGMKFVNLAFFW